VLGFLAVIAGASLIARKEAEGAKATAGHPPGDRSGETGSRTS
jgi:hypothetical protein